jgi:hypothetical protein
MILTRTMTIDVDLPDAPAGYSWLLNHDSGAQVLLMRDGDPVSVGCLTGLGNDLGCPVLVDTRGTRGGKSVECKTDREAAYTLLYMLNLASLGDVDDAIQAGKVQVSA